MAEFYGEYTQAQIEAVTGVPIEIIIEYQKQGFIIPKMRPSARGEREIIYSAADAKHIHELYNKHLERQDEVEASDEADDEIVYKDITAKELAKKVGVSYVSMLKYLKKLKIEAVNMYYRHLHAPAHYDITKTNLDDIKALIEISRPFIIMGHKRAAKRTSDEITQIDDGEWLLTRQILKEFPFIPSGSLYGTMHRLNAKYKKICGSGLWLVTPKIKAKLEESHEVYFKKRYPRDDTNIAIPAPKKADFKQEAKAICETNAQNDELNRENCDLKVENIQLKEQVANLQITNAKLISEIASVKAQLQELKQIQHQKSFEIVEPDKKQNIFMRFLGA